MASNQHNKRDRSDADASPAKRQRLDFRNSFHVLVGKDKQAFTVHEAIICPRSPFFAAAIRKPWRSGQKHAVVELPEDNPDAFDMYLNCVYNDCLIPSNEYELCVELIDLYIFADKIGDLKAANQVIDALQLSEHASPFFPAVRDTAKVLNNTKPGSPLRKLFVDSYLHARSCSPVVELWVVHFPEFCVDLLKEFYRLKAEQPDNTVGEVLSRSLLEMPGCRYHQHNKECPEEICDADRQIRFR